MKKYTCPCCGYKTFDEDPLGNICNNCYWEDDNLMNENPDYWGGANGVCLRQAQRNFIRYGASEKLFIDKVKKGNYEKDPLWKPVWEKEATPTEHKLTEIIIEGNVINSGFKKSVHINKFIDEFTEFLEQKGWSFGGEIKQEITEIDEG